MFINPISGACLTRYLETDVRVRAFYAPLHDLWSVRLSCCIVTVIHSSK